MFNFTETLVIFKMMLQKWAKVTEKQYNLVLSSKIRDTLCMYDSYRKHAIKSPIQQIFQKKSNFYIKPFIKRHLLTDA